MKGSRPSPWPWLLWCRAIRRGEVQPERDQKERERERELETNSAVNGSSGYYNVSE